MKCPKCKSEVELGDKYCPKCGEEIILVDYSLLDDVDLQTMQKTEDYKVQDNASSESINSDDITETNDITDTDKTNNWFVDKIWRNKKNRIIFIVLAILIVLIVAFSIFFTSYTYKMMQGANFDEKGKYEEGIECYEKALNKRPNSIDARVAMANDYIKLEKYSKAEDLLLEAIKLDDKSVSAYTTLIMLYTITNDVDKLNELKSGIIDANILKLFDSSVVSTPTFSVPTGEYKDDQKVTINCQGADIYYTLDGTNPDKNSGIKYTNPIEIKSGETTLKAIGYKGENKSMVAIAKYEINYEAPDYPDVSPSSGSFVEPTEIVINSKTNDGKIYYTWDGTVPTSSSEEYFGPITVPEGNNILSIIVIDKHGLTSNVLKCNYQYTP